MTCTNCGREIHDSATMCEYCGTPVKTAPGEKRENILAGTVGALLGGLLGGGCIILLDQMGYVASLSGLILAICALKGYELLGGRLSKIGVIVSIVMMILIPFVANQVSTAISFMGYARESGDVISFARAFAAVPALISPEGYDTGLYYYTMESSSYYGGLAMIYLFAALGAFSTIYGAAKKSTKKQSGNPV